MFPSQPLTQGVLVTWMRVPRLQDSELRALMAFLRPEDASKAMRFVHCEDRAAYGAAHCMVEWGLHAATGRIHPPLRITRLGKPRLASLPVALHFNASHARGLVAVAWSTGRHVGVDVEPQWAGSIEPSLVSEYFSEMEQQALASCAHPGELFTQLWVMKEAVVKAAGAGLSFPLRRLAFEAATTDREAPWVRVRPLRCLVSTRAVAPHHCAAVAVRTQSGTLECCTWQEVCLPEVLEDLKHERPTTVEVAQLLRQFHREAFRDL